MAYEALEKHLLQIGIAPLEGDEYMPIGDSVWDELGLPKGAQVPEVIRWFFRRFGGCRFPDGAYYRDPRDDKDLMVGWFLNETELREANESAREVLPREMVLISNDGGDNHLAIGTGPANAGVVYFHVHDAPEGANVYEIEPSAEHFLASLHRER